MNIHVVDVLSATDELVATGPYWWVIGYLSDGIYVIESKYDGESQNGLWRIDSSTGRARELLPKSATAVRLGVDAAWGPDPAFRSGTLYRYDLRTGAREIWYTRPDAYVVYEGSDALDRPLVAVGSERDPGVEIWLLSGPNKGALIYSTPDGFQVGKRDSHGTWMYGRSGLWLLQPTSQLLHVTTAQVRPLGECR
jgi:hypothetical protein